MDLYWKSTHPGSYSGASDAQELALERLMMLKTSE
jgi:hypothetical protein